MIEDGSKIYGPCRIGDRVFIGPNSVVVNDNHPKAIFPKVWEPKDGTTIIEDDSSISSNCTILAGIKIGRNAVVGAGAVVVEDVVSGTTNVGVPSKPIG